MTETKWFVGQAVVVMHGRRVQSFTTIQRIYVGRDKAVSSFTTENGRQWHASGLEKGARWSLDSVEPATKEHEAMAKRQDLSLRIAGLRETDLEKVPTEALEAFVAALDAARKG